MKPWIIMGNGRIGRLRGVAYDFGMLLQSLPFLAFSIWAAFHGQVIDGPRYI